MLRRVLAAWCATVIAGALTVTVAAGSATAAGSAWQPEPWEPWIQEEWTAEAGRYCTFPLHVDVISQDIQRRVLERYPDGTVMREEYAGPLIVDFVNVDTGQRVRHDVGGRAYPEYRIDGSFLRYLMVGPVGFGFRDGDRYPKGYYEFDGVHLITFDADGTRNLAYDGGDEENVCRSLGDTP